MSPQRDSSSEPTQGKSQPTPFQKATRSNRRLKVFLWGDSGVGKTTLALSFPQPAVIDMEGGTELYGGTRSFHVLRATTADEAMGAVDSLLTAQHDYQTLVIDPITVYWDALQRKWSDIFLHRNKQTKGFKFDFYDFQPRDWMTIKAELKEFVRKLVALDMNVVVTARQKHQYAEGQLMRVVGETFDGEKSLPYLFDIILHLSRSEGGRHMSTCIKDRSGKLPKAFETSYDVFEKAFGKDSLEQKAKAVVVADPGERATPQQVKTLQESLQQLGFTVDQVRQRLKEHGASKLEDLTQGNANTIIEKLSVAISQREAAQA